MNETKKVFLATLLITGMVTALTIVGTIVFLYRTAIEEQKGRLMEFVTNEARMIQVIHDETAGHQHDKSSDVRCSMGLKKILSRLPSSHQAEKAGSGGKLSVLNFYIGERQGDMVKFHRGTAMLKKKPVPFAQVEHFPMGLALRGGTKVFEGSDHMGNPILCAYTGVPEIEIGLVAKIFKKDLRRPFQIAGLFAGICALILLVFCSLLIKRMVSPLVSALESHRKELQEQNEALLVKATTDQLTGLYNRQYFNERLQQSLSYSQRYKHPVSLIMLDIDSFKEINDTYGHLAGDEVLMELSELMADNIRETDIIARWGGEEFIILTFKTDTETAGKIAEKLRALIAKTEVSVKQQITCSFGVTTYTLDEEMSELLNRVDEALYKAKLEGRNTVVSM